MKKLLALILFIAFVSTGNAQVYVAGDHNGWGLDGTSQATLKTNLGAVPYYGYTLQPTATQNFKVINGGWGTDWGDGFWITGYNQRWTPGWQGANAVWQGAPNTYVHVSIQDPNSYGGTNIPLGIMTLSAAPATVTGSQIGVLVGATYFSGTGNQTVNITTNVAPSPEEKIYVRYSTNGFATDNFALATGGGTSWSATIPGQGNGSTVSYYVLTTTLTHAGGNDLDVYPDLMTINYDVNGGANWSYTTTSNFISVQSGNWATGSTWITGSAPTAGDDVTVTAGHSVIIDSPANAHSVTIDGNLAHNTSTLTVNGGGSLTLNGTFTSFASIIFSNGGAVSGSFAFYNLVIQNGGLSGLTGCTMTNELRIGSGGFVVNTDAPTYLANSRLTYDIGGPYTVSNGEWFDNTFSGPGVPQSVEVMGGTTLSFGTSTFYRRCNKNFSVFGGASATLSSGVGGDLRIGGNFLNSGTFNNNGREVQMDGSSAQTITSSTALDFSYLRINNGSGVSILSGSSIIQVTAILSLEAGTFTTNNKLTINSDAAGTGVLDNFSGGFTGAISGNLTMERNISGAGFHYIAPQMTGASTATFNGIPWSGPNGAAIIPDPACITTAIDPTSPYGTAFEWSESGPFPTDCYQEGWIIKSSGGFTPGKGFAANLNAGTISQTGTIQTGTVTYSGLQNNPNATLYGGGWNMVANPYCSPVVWSPADGINIAAFGQRWQPTGQYAGTYQAIPPGTVLASGQAVFAGVTSTPGSMVFQNSQRNTDLNTPFYREASKENTLEIIVKGNHLADRTSVNFNSSSINGFNPMEDAQKLIGDPQRPTLYTLINGEMTSFNSLDANDLPAFIDLAFRTDVSGSFTLNFNGIDNMNIARDIFLLDRTNGAKLNLNHNSTYSFEATSNDPALRFRLIFENENEGSVSHFAVNTENGQLQLFGVNEASNVISILDATGKVISVDANNQTGIFTKDISSLSKGIYLINVEGSGTEKFVIQ